jgi:acyl carrier protein
VPTNMTADNHATANQEVAQLMVDALHLEISPHEIQPDEPLFGEGLGLDSIDALEIALAISRTYGFELKSDEGRAHQVFASLRNLTRYIDEHRTK